MIKRLGDFALRAGDWRLEIGRAVFWLMIAINCLLVTGNLSAQESITDDEVNEVAKELYCPVCESTPLDVCPTQACIDWREEIREMLANGESEQTIIDQFAEQYGDRVLATPPTRGFGWLAWLMPLVGVIFGGLFFFRYMQQLDKREVVVESADNPPIPENDYMARVEAELKDRLGD